MGEKIISIEIIFSNENFDKGADYLLCLGLIEIREGVIISRVIKSRKLDELQW